MTRASVDDRKFYVLRDLSFYPEVYERIAMGWPLAKLCTFIQEERGELNHIKRGALLSLLRDFRTALPDSVKVQHVAPTTHLEAVARVVEGLDVLEEAERLYRLQMERIDIALKVETDAEMLDPNTHKEIKEARALLEMYHNTQADLGLVNRNLGSIHVEEHRSHQMSLVVEQHGEVAKEALTQKGGQSRVLQAFQRIIMLAEKEKEQANSDAIDVTPAPSST